MGVIIYVIGCISLVECDKMRASERKAAPAVREHPGARTTGRQPYGQSKDTEERADRRGQAHHCAGERHPLPQRNRERRRAPAASRPDQAYPQTARACVAYAIPTRHGGEAGVSWPSFLSWA